MLLVLLVESQSFIVGLGNHATTEIRMVLNDMNILPQRRGQSLVVGCDFRIQIMTNRSGGLHGHLKKLQALLIFSILMHS